MKDLKNYSSKLIKSLLIIYLIILSIFPFSPLMQSPVKLRVEAFEHVAAANTISNQLTTSSHLSRLPKAKKENIGPTVKQ